MYSRLIASGKRMGLAGLLNGQLHVAGYNVNSLNCICYFNLVTSTPQLYYCQERSFSLIWRLDMMKIIIARMVQISWINLEQLQVETQIQYFFSALVSDFLPVINFNLFLIHLKFITMYWKSVCRTYIQYILIYFYTWLSSQDLGQWFSHQYHYILEVLRCSVGPHT